MKSLSGIFQKKRKYQAAQNLLSPADNNLPMRLVDINQITGGASPTRAEIFGEYLNLSPEGAKKKKPPATDPPATDEKEKITYSGQFERLEEPEEPEFDADFVRKGRNVAKLGALQQGLAALGQIGAMAAGRDTVPVDFSGTGVAALDLLNQYDRDYQRRAENHLTRVLAAQKYNTQLGNKEKELDLAARQKELDKIEDQLEEATDEGKKTELWKEKQYLLGKLSKDKDGRYIPNPDEDEIEDALSEDEKRIYAGMNARYQELIGKWQKNQQGGTPVYIDKDNQPQYLTPTEQQELEALAENEELSRLRYARAGLSAQQQAAYRRKVEKVRSGGAGAKAQELVQTANNPNMEPADRLEQIDTLYKEIAEASYEEGIDPSDIFPASQVFQYKMQLRGMAGQPDNASYRPDPSPSAGPADAAGGVFQQLQSPPASQPAAQPPVQTPGQPTSSAAPPPRESLLGGAEAIEGGRGAVGEFIDQTISSGLISLGDWMRGHVGGADSPMNSAGQWLKQTGADMQIALLVGEARRKMQAGNLSKDDLNQLGDQVLAIAGANRVDLTPEQVKDYLKEALKS